MCLTLRGASVQLRYFDEGKRDVFFQAFQQYVPASTLSYDLAAQRLEFTLNIYFSIYPVLPSSSGGQNHR